MKYDAIVIGFGQGATSIVGQLSQANWHVALIEKDPLSYGGSCINFGCIPTKLLDHDAKAGKPYTEVIERRDHDIAQKRNEQKNTMEENAKVDLYTGKGVFEDNDTVKVFMEDGGIETLTSDYIIIDTGSSPVIPEIEGIDDTTAVYTSRTLQTEKKLPKHLGIVGGGNIGLEFASIYANFGSTVEVFDSADQFMKEEEPEIAEAIEEVLNDKEVTIHSNTQITQVKQQGKKVIATTDSGEEYNLDGLLIATGRKPNIDGLGLENTDIAVNDKGGVQTDDHVQTTVPGVYAIGDARGEEMFTYITLKDAAIATDHILEDGDLLLSNRKNVPYTIYIDPSLSRLGLTEQSAKNQGYDIITNTIPLEGTPRATVINDGRGLFKTVINKENNEILGVSLFGPESHELINQIKMAMDNHIPYTYIRDQMMTHPVMSEQLNNLFTI